MQTIISLFLIFGLASSIYISMDLLDSNPLYETDVLETLQSSTVTAGEPFVPISGVVTGISALTQGSIIFAANSGTTTISSYIGSTPTLTAATTPPGKASSLGHSLSVKGSVSRVQESAPLESTLSSTGQKLNSWDTADIYSGAAPTTSYGSSGVTTNTLNESNQIPSSFSINFSQTVTRQSSVSDKSSIFQSTLLQKNGTTTTSTLFSSSTPVSSSNLIGSFLTSITSITKDPLVTNVPSFSSQETKIIPSSLNSNKTISASPLTTSVSEKLVQSASITSSSVLSATSTSGFSFANQTATSFNSTQSENASSHASPIRSEDYTESATTSSHYTSMSAITSDTSTAASSSEMVTSISSTPSQSKASKTTATIVNLFSAISADEPPAVFSRAENPMSLAEGVSSGGTIQTNKFYTNLIVGSQKSAAFVYPYSLWQYTSQDCYGFAVQHTTSSQYAFGDYDSSGNSEFLVNPLGIADVILSASSFDAGMIMEVDDMTLSSARVILEQSNDASSYLEIPLVQGMGFASGIYHGSLNAKIGSSIGFKTLALESSSNLAQGVLKYRITLLNGVTWLCYVIGPADIGTSTFSLEVTSTSQIEANCILDGLIIQLAVAPTDEDYDIFYDQAAGMYATGFELRGVSDGSSATYEFQYTTQGESASGRTMVFALPHHKSSFSDAMQNYATGIELQSTTKGIMTGFLTTSLQFAASLNREVTWLPWSSQLGSTPLTYSADQLQLLAEVANAELQVSISASINGLNTYYLGKVIDKYAYILLTVSQIIQDEETTMSTLDNLKSAFEILLQNNQMYPLIYDTKFGGIVSSGDWDSTSTQYDFGNTYYNDHHFHYGYIVHAAAVVGYVDSQLGGSWAKDNKEWINSLIRDVANPSTEDQYFAQSRMFDWYQGHSWAAGLFENGNGKNEESSSEDYNFAYGMKLWGAVIGDHSMEFRGDLMISIMKDSMNEYFYYQDDNSVEPQQIIGNKVSGILFDNIIDYTTYFGTNTEYIHGIHMLPITPVSSNIRTQSFVQQEWDAKLSPLVDSLKSGWTGILRLNQALFDPADSYSFFSDLSFDSNVYLDNGMSRTWSLAFSGGLANSLGLL